MNLFFSCVLLIFFAFFDEVDCVFHALRVQVFQPLLMKYFTYEELIHIKTTVIVEHEIKQRDYAGQAQLEEDKENDTSGQWLHL